MKFTRTEFDPAIAGTPLDGGRVVSKLPLPPAKPTSTYVYDEALILAVNVAIATGRPLLLAGEPGCGKTSVAANIALVKAWPMYEQTIGSRSRASELLWEIDTLRRLSDAYDTSTKVLADRHYVQPGKLWWALAPGSAARRGLDPGEQDTRAPAVVQPAGHSAELAGAVLLIDEIDKAEPDLPNDLLDVLDTRSIQVLGQRLPLERNKLLIVITTNLERELPGAFVRRCVVHRFAEAKAGWFVAIARQRFDKLDATLATAVETQLLIQRGLAGTRGQRLPGTAEYLDAIAALQAVGVKSLDGDNTAAWDVIQRCLFDKHSLLDA